MHEILIDEITISDDIAAGEIVKVEIQVEGKQTGFFLIARVGVNDGNTVTLNYLDLPIAYREQNKVAAQKLSAVLAARFN
jgi:hypothetical protein